MDVEGAGRLKNKWSHIGREDGSNVVLEEKKTSKTCEFMNWLLLSPFQKKSVKNS